MRSAVAPESKRAQASASSMTTLAMVSMPMGQHLAVEVAQHRVSSLPEDLSEKGLDNSWQKGKHGPYVPVPPLSTHFDSLYFA